MSEQSYLVSEDLKEAEGMVEGLIPYLESNEVYGRIGGGGIFGGGNQPALTAGALEMRLRRLRLLRDQMNADQQTRLDALEARYDDTLKDWRAHYERRLLREANSRLDAMRPFFQETTENPRLADSVYKPELLRRTIVQDIMNALERLGVDSSELSSKARQVDSRFRGVIGEAAPFQWDAQLEPVYPQKDYWWLYRKPREV